MAAVCNFQHIAIMYALCFTHDTTTKTATETFPQGAFDILLYLSRVVGLKGMVEYSNLAAGNKPAVTASPAMATNLKSSLHYWLLYCWIWR